MDTVTIDFRDLAIQEVHMTEDTLAVDLSDGRSISVPLVWFPRLWHGTDAERGEWRLIGNGAGIHWPALDEDVSVESLILGKPSSESQSSLSRWLEARNAMSDNSAE